MAGRLDQIKGAMKDAYGRLTGDKRARAEGKTDKAKGKAKEAAQSVKDTAKGVKDSLKE